MDALVLAGQQHVACLKALSWMQKFEKATTSTVCSLLCEFLSAIADDPDGHAIDRNYTHQNGQSVVDAWLMMFAKHFQYSETRHWTTIFDSRKDKLAALVSPRQINSRWLFVLCQEHTFRSLQCMWKPLLESAKCHNPHVFLERCSDSGRTPLSVYVRINHNTHDPLLAHLAECAMHCGDIDPNLRDGTTSLSHAVSDGHLNAVECLLQTTRLPMGLEWRCRTTGKDLTQLAATSNNPQIACLVNSHVTLLRKKLMPILTKYIADSTPLIPPLAQIVVDQLAG
jgi:hypothetical protein